ncbi:MAG: ATP-binding cassette domain-containing protein [Methanoregula sp.]|jgi:cobalt/nickel transport system ATP-binding protein|nr:ATP-binding cassette domain-containing protein [Methanoregula sp.]
MSSIILEARDVRYRYPRGMEAVCGISFHIRRKEKIALVGPNGAGKSTLLKMFNGMIRPDSGLMLFDNQPVMYDTASLRMLRKRVGFVLQNPDRQIIAPTVYQDVAFGPTNLGYPENEVKRIVTVALRHVGLEGFERRPPHQISGGEKKRVAIAGVLAMDPDVLVLDEPTSGLDPSGSEDIMELLDELNHEGKTIIISTHNVELAYPWADRAILMLEGKILEEDIPEKAFGNTEYVRRAHLSLPTLLELHTELQKRGFHLPGKKPHTVLDMMHCIETIVEKTTRHTQPGTITLYNVDGESQEILSTWLSSRSGIPVGAMGTRAKQQAEISQIRLDFTYGVIDKCILKALLGENTLIMTTGSMVQRVNRRVDAYCRESGIRITVNQLIPVPESSDEVNGSLT